MMDADSGVINNFLKLFGLDPVWWLQADHSLWAVIIANIWLGIPFNLVILYSGLQNINGDLYEAAALDGCNAWQRFWKITSVAQAGIDDHAPARFRLHVTNSRHHLDYDQGHWIFENLGNLGL